MVRSPRHKVRREFGYRSPCSFVATPEDESMTMGWDFCTQITHSFPTRRFAPTTFSKIVPPMISRARKPLNPRPKEKPNVPSAEIHVSRSAYEVCVEQRREAVGWRLNLHRKEKYSSIACSGRCHQGSTRLWVVWKPICFGGPTRSKTTVESVGLSD